MQYTTTQSPYSLQTLDIAITEGLATDGGLYLPTEFPRINPEDFSADSDYADFAAQLLAPFFFGSSLKNDLPQLCQAAFDFPLSLNHINSTTYLLELFHGPTLSFKDFGARFLAECLNRLSHDKQRTVLVATSGDTGSAVASAFHHKSQLNVVVLFPEGQISARQQAQITCWGDNVHAIAIDGSFDDCQKLVKSAFKNQAFAKYHLTSANSINIGRLLPQMVYYAYASMQLAQSEQPVNFIVPSGNLGNVTAAYWAKTMGFPIGRIAIACNANRVLPDYVHSGKFSPRASLHTLANAMDVGNPSNFARLQNLFPDYEEFIQHVSAFSVTDEQIRQAIINADKNDKTVICPHTATGYYLRWQLPINQNWVIAATAHPAKFEAIIEPLLNTTLPIPKQLQWMLEQKADFSRCEANLQELALQL